MISAFISCSVKAQSDEAKLYPISFDGKFGFVNSDSKIIIPLIYDRVSFFEDGLAIVSKDHTHGVIDKQGKVVVSLMKYAIGRLKNNFTRVFNGKTIVYNNKGKVVLECENCNVQTIDIGNRIVVKSKQYNEYRYDKIDVYSEKFELLFSLPGEHIQSVRVYPPSEITRVYPFYKVKRNVDRNDIYSLYDFDGKLMLENVASDFQFKFGKAVITYESDNPLNTEVIIKRTYVGIDTIITHNIQGLIDTNFRIILDTALRYKSIKYYDDTTIVVKKDGKYGIVDIDGNIKIPIESKYDFKIYERYVHRLDPRHTRILNHRGNDIVPAGYYLDLYNTDSINISKEGLIVVQIRKKQKFGVIKAGGEIVIPFDYEFISDFVNGYSMFRKGNLTGYMNIKGEEVVFKDYDRFGPFKNGWALVGKKVEFEKPKIRDMESDMIPWELTNEELQVSDGPKNHCASKFHENRKSYEIQYNLVNAAKEKRLASSVYQVLHLDDTLLIVVDLDCRTKAYIHNKELKLPSNHTLFSGFKNGYAMIQSADNKFGLINYKGKVTMPAVYNKLLFEDSKSGQTPQYYQRGHLTFAVLKPLDVPKIHQGVIVAKKGDRWGFLTVNNTNVTGFDFNAVAQSYNSGGHYRVFIHDGFTMNQGLVSTSGQLIVKPIYKEVAVVEKWMFGEKVYKVQKDDQDFWITLAGKVIQYKKP